MINVQVQCCGMLLLWLTTYFYCKSRRMNLRTQRIFSALLLISNLCVIADIFSVFAIYYSDRLPAFVVMLSCKVYLILLIALAYSGLMYICSDTYFNDRTFHQFQFFYSSIFFVSAVLILVLPISYLCESGGMVIYSDGAAASVAYLSALIAFIGILVHIYLGRKILYPRRKKAVILWLAIWVLAAILQYLNHSLLVVTFAGIMGVVIIFSMIENPDSSLDRASGLFNMNAMKQYLQYAYGNQNHFYMLCFPFLPITNALVQEYKHAYSFIGGGEFFVILDNSDDFHALFKELRSLNLKDTIYVVPDSGIADSPQELLRLLNEAQGLSKREQHDCVCYVDAKFKQSLKQRKDTEQLIYSAIEQDRVEVFYQPIYSAADQCFSSAEALVRIRNTDGSIIPPNVFIPVAEDNGSIIQLGKIILEKVCRFLSESADSMPGIQYIEVNLSVVQAEDPELATDVIKTIQKYNIPCDRINLEITESASVKGKQQILSNMQTLLDKGIHFSLDDFGTGHSNLDYMASMPIHIVKFDRTMTQDYFQSNKTRHVMNAAIKMIHDMEMKIVAEGIETKEQFDFINEQNVEFIQGYYFSKPIPEKEFLSFLMKYNRK